MSRYNELLAKKERLEKEISQQQARLQAQSYRASDKLRKQRTRRLIQKGALLEKYFDIEHLSPEDTEKLLAHFSGIVIRDMPEVFKKNKTPE